MPDGGRSAAWGLRYQYLRTLEALMGAAEEPDGVVVALHVEGLPLDGGTAPDSIDYELADAVGEIALAVQVKARAPGTQVGAGQVFKALNDLVKVRNASRYELLISADAGESANRLVAILRSKYPPQVARDAIDEVLSSVSANNQLSLLENFTNEQFARLLRAEVKFDSRDEDEIIEQIRSRLRVYRNGASAGLGEQSAGLLIGYLISEIFRRAAHETEATMTVARFREVLLADGTTVARALGRRDWGVVVGSLPLAPEIRRADLLTQVQQALPMKARGLEVPICRLAGLSGIGKTSLAVGYVLERADIYDTIFWVDAESEITLASSFTRIHRELRGRDVPVPADPDVLRNDVLSDLSCAAGRWLLVLDNCVDLRLVDSWVPRIGTGHVIATTIDSASPPWASTMVSVNGMTTPQAIELLSRGLDMQVPADGPKLQLLVRLAQEMECWPLGLKLACAYLCGGYGIDDIPDYLDKMKVPSLNNPDLVPPNYPLPLVQAIELCVQRIKERMASPEPTAARAAATAIAVLRISAYVSPRQIPVYLVRSAWEIAPGVDAFRGSNPIVADDLAVPAAEIVRVLRAQSLVAVDERLAPYGVDDLDIHRFESTIQVNSVIQEVMQFTMDRDPATNLIIDRLAWHTERWLQAAVEATAHERTLTLAGHAAVIDAHAARLGRKSDFIAYLRGNLAGIYLRQNNMEEAVRLLRLEIGHFRGRSESYARLLTSQADIQLATALAALIDDGTIQADRVATTDQITDLVESAYFFIQSIVLEDAPGASYLAAAVYGLLQDLDLIFISNGRLNGLRSAVSDLVARLPATQISNSLQVSQEIVDCMNDLRNVPRAIELARGQLEDLSSAVSHQGIRLRGQARKMLIEALSVQRELDAALVELEQFIVEAQPPIMYVRDFEYLIHNVGLMAALLSWTRFPKAAELLSLLLSGNRAELVQQAFPGDASVRVRLLCGVNALHQNNLSQAKQCLDDFRSRFGDMPRVGEPQKLAAWRRIANVLVDAIELEMDKACGYTRPASKPHDMTGIARYMFLSSHYRNILFECPPGHLPLMAILAAFASGFSRSLTGRAIPACFVLRGALKNLGIRAEITSVVVYVQNNDSGAVEIVGKNRSGLVEDIRESMLMHPVLWVDQPGWMIDPTILQVQNLHKIPEGSELAGVPITLPLPTRKILFNPAPGLTLGCERTPLMIAFEPQPSGTQEIFQVAGGDTEVGVAYGQMTLTYAAIELIQALQEIRSDTVDLNVVHPVVAKILDGRVHLSALPDEPPAEFLRMCHPPVSAE